MIKRNEVRGQRYYSLNHTASRNYPSIVELSTDTAVTTRDPACTDGGFIPKPAAQKPPNDQSKLRCRSNKLFSFDAGGPAYCRNGLTVVRKLLAR